MSTRQKVQATDDNRKAVAAYPASPYEVRKLAAKERKLAIARLYLLESKTLQDVGDEFGISRERVRQILNELGVKTDHSHRTNNRARDLAALEERTDEVCNAYKEIGNIAKTAKVYGVPPVAMREFLRGRLSDAEMRAHRRTGAYTLTQKAGQRSLYIRRLREAASVVGEPLSKQSFDVVAAERGWVSGQTVMKAFGSWREACAAAGVAANKQRRAAYVRKFDRDDCIAAVEIASDHYGHFPTYQQYEAFASASHGRFPSGPLVRQRVGSWTTINRLMQENQAA